MLGYYILEFKTWNNPNPPAWKSSDTEISVVGCFNGFPNPQTVVNYLRINRQDARDIFILEEDDWTESEMDRYIEEILINLQGSGGHPDNSERYVLIRQDDRMTQLLLGERIIIMHWHKVYEWGI